MYLSDDRYEVIKQEVVDMYEDCELTTYPVDYFEIAQRINYKLIPYSRLSGKKLIVAMQVNTDSFHILVKEKSTGILRKLIFYNDGCCCERQRWTILHEIGHIRLNHTQENDLTEAEANFFTKYSIAPPPLVHIAHCENYIDIANKFNMSQQAAYYAMCYYQKWLLYGSVDFELNEVRMLRFFGIAA